MCISLRLYDKVDCEFAFRYAPAMVCVCGLYQMVSYYMSSIIYVLATAKWNYTKGNIIMITSDEGTMFVFLLSQYHQHTGTTYDEYKSYESISWNHDKVGY